MIAEKVLWYLKATIDLPFPSRVEAELDLWEEYWLSEKEIFPCNFSQTLKAVDFTGFQNIKQLN